MVSDAVYMTADGLTKLKEELRMRVEEKRVEIAERLDVAIKMGDLKENADYHVAKEDQGFNEGRVKQLQDSISRAEVIKQPTGISFVGLGSTVTIAEEDYEDEEESYTIVGAQEADPSKGMISNESPIGKALLGAKINEVVTAKTPGGTISLKILKIGL